MASGRLTRLQGDMAPARIQRGATVRGQVASKAKDIRVGADMADLSHRREGLMESLGWKVMRISWLKRMELDKRPEQERREFWFKEPGGFGVVPSK